MSIKIHESPDSVCGICATEYREGQHHCGYLVLRIEELKADVDGRDRCIRARDERIATMETELEIRRTNGAAIDALFPGGYDEAADLRARLQAAEEYGARADERIRELEQDLADAESNLRNAVNQAIDCAEGRMSCHEAIDVPAPTCELGPSPVPGLAGAVYGVASFESRATAEKLTGGLTTFAEAVTSARKAAESPEQRLVHTYKELLELVLFYTGSHGPGSCEALETAEAALAPFVARMLAKAAA